jgi:hypothetical protein
VGAQPPDQVGQLSPDGMWRWDGQRWAPVGQPGQAIQYPPPRSRRWIWWVAGGCALLLVIAIVGGAVGIVSLVRSLQSVGLTCLPADFPQYQGATVAREYTYVGSGTAPGDSHECQESLDSNDDATTITAYYTSHLNSDDWKITGTDTANGEIRFSRVSRPLTVGVIDILGRGQHAVIEVKLDS